MNGTTNKTNIDTGGISNTSSKKVTIYCHFSFKRPRGETYGIFAVAFYSDFAGKDLITYKVRQIELWKDHQFVTAMVPNYFGDRFAVIYGQREGYPTKPDGSLVDLVLKELGAKPEETVYLGDTSVDMETARNGKVFAVGVLWGFRTKEELLESGAQALIAKPQELFDLL